MIPQAYIKEWNQFVPWQSNELIEQDLVISRALVEIFSDPVLSDHLAFRGGTAIHKLFLQPQKRYSEDIDLVQITAKPFGTIADRIKEKLAFLGEPKRSPKSHNFTLLFRFESEFPPVVNLRLKVETNTKEHFSVTNLIKIPFGVSSSWFSGNCSITTYRLEELLGTKLRALYQRRKGRDLYDLYMAILSHPALDSELILRCYSAYMSFSVKNPPTSKEFVRNMEEKMNNIEFLGDTKGLLRPDENYDPYEAWEIVKTELVEKL